MSNVYTKSYNAHALDPIARTIGSRACTLQQSTRLWIVMMGKKKSCEARQLDTREFDLPETVFSRDIENKVFQEIVLNILSRISGIGLLEGTFLENVIGRVDKIKGISIEQDLRSKSVKITIEISVQYGVNIPKKAEEIQTALVEEITKMTGLHVSEVHVIFKQLTHDEPKVDEPAPPRIPVEIAHTFHEDLQSEF